MFSISSSASLLTIVFSVVLLAVGIGVIGYLCSLLFSAFSSSFGGVFEQSALRRYIRRCRQGDALLEHGDLVGAMRIFSESFFLKPIRRDSSLLSDIANYHTGLLSRLLTVADELGKGSARLLSLAETDRLLAERLEIQLEYFRLRKRGETKLLREIEPRLRENEAEVRATVRRLIEEIRTSEERVMYH